MSKVHSHLIVSASVRSPHILPGDLIAWMHELVSKVDMEVFMGGRAKYCADPTNSGITGDVVITTSHSSIHIWDTPQEDGYPRLEFDLYSCKTFDPKIVLDHLSRFDPVRLDWIVVDRNDKSKAPTWQSLPLA